MPIDGGAIAPSNRLVSETRQAEPLAGERFAAHVAGLRFRDLPLAAVAAAKVFVLDTIGVAVAGSSAGGMDALHAAAVGWGDAPDAAAWGRATRLPAPAAALLNAAQAHCQEFDCVHEPAVLHPLATLLPAAIAVAERQGGVAGRDLIAAVAAGTDVAISLGVASRSPLRFFRPASSGGFGAAAAAAKLLGLDADGVLAAFGLQYAQSSGTMQPHVEGSIALPLQVGFNSRAAVTSADLARSGLTGARDVFEGPYGYLRLFEGEWDLAPALAALGRRWRIAELSHKPYPAGRATHAAIEGVARLRDAHGFGAEDVESVVLEAPPVIQRLCGRIPHPAMSASYARLSTGFAVAKLLLEGELDLSHYRGAALHDPASIALARRVQVTVNDVTDPNALTPQRVTVRLRSGATHAWDCDAMLANPARPLTREQHLRKFRRCWSFAATPLGDPDAVIAMVDALDTLDDVRTLTRLLQPSP